MNYCVITADVNKSRDIPERQALQGRILEAISQVNRDFKDHLIAKFAITLGDEWQGVLQDLTQSYRVVSFFQEALHPISVSFGVGTGEITTELASNPAEMDGSVFHHSRQALESGKQSAQQVFYVTQNAASDLILNTALHLLQILRTSWTERQYQKVVLYKKYQKEKLVASELKVTQADINKALLATNGRAYLEAEKKINHYLDLLLSSYPTGDD
ncbi:MAG: SatD family protein [bacterium]